MVHVTDILWYGGILVVGVFFACAFAFVLTKIVVSAFYETKAYYLTKQKQLKERYRKMLKGDLHE